MEYITLTKGDAEFESYLLGTFSTDKRALPVETFHGQEPGERVTFRVVPVSKIEIPPWWNVYFHSCRPELASLTLGPSMAAWLNHYASLAQWTRWPSWFALLGIFFLHTAAFLFNDFQDHMRGTDRVNRRRGSQVIQNGWVTAVQMRKWAWLNAGLAVLFGIPAFFNAPLELTAICILAVLALATISQSWGRRWGLCDFAMFMLFGPLLTCGIALASFSKFNQADIFLGAALGALTVWVIHVRQIEFLFRSKPEMFRTLLGFLPFERARILVMTEAYLVLLLQLGVSVWLRLPMFFIILTLAVGWPMILTVQNIQKASSPLASPLAGISKWALGSHLTWTIWWLLALGSVWV